ncbi:MAG: deoxynucleoside kinase [Armatimonadetes bacterium]|nr:deoxynucleoside kinase [Armatimonadota bacterium]
MFIIISGPIGVGKSTVTRIYSQVTNYEPLFETVEGHPYLEKFYLNSKEYSFRTQAFFLWDRFNKHFKMVNSGKNIVADRSIYEDAIFARVLNLRGEMDNDDYYKTYLPHFKLLTSILRPPDLMIYLKASLDTLLYRIRKRSRDMEKDIEPEYMRLLLENYEEWIADYPHKKLIVETEDLDLTCDLHPEWLLFFKAIHQKVLNDELPDEVIGLTKLKQELPLIHSSREKILEIFN